MPRTVEGRVVVERILAMRREGESEAEFARRLGVKQQQLSNWKAKTPDLPMSTLLKMLENTGVDPRAILWADGAADWPEELREALGRSLQETLDRFWHERGLGGKPRPSGTLDPARAPKPGESKPEEPKKRRRRGGLGD